MVLIAFYAMLFSSFRDTRNDKLERFIIWVLKKSEIE